MNRFEEEQQRQFRKDHGFEDISMDIHMRKFTPEEAAALDGAMARHPANGTFIPDNVLSSNGDGEASDLQMWNGVVPVELEDDVFEPWHHEAHHEREASLEEKLDTIPPFAVNTIAQLSLQLEEAHRTKQGVPYEVHAEVEDRLQTLADAIRGMYTQDFEQGVDFPDPDTPLAESWGKRGLVFSSHWFFRKGVDVALEELKKLVPDTKAEKVPVYLREMEDINSPLLNDLDAHPEDEESESFVFANRSYLLHEVRAGRAHFPQCDKSNFDALSLGSRIDCTCRNYMQEYKDL